MSALSVTVVLLENCLMTTATVKPNLWTTRVLRRSLGHALVYFLLLSGAVLILVPFWWMLTTSLKQPSEVFAFPPTIWPKVAQWHNYVDIFDKAPFLLYFRNTAIISLLDLIGTLISSRMVGFAFARLR